MSAQMPRCVGGLEVRDVHVSYGPIKAVRGVSLAVRPGEIVSLVGSNGAGKSAVLQAIVGAVPLAGGTLLLDGNEVSPRTPEGLVRLGVSLCPEGRQILSSLTVQENLLLGGWIHRRKKTSVIGDLLVQVYDLFPRLQERKNQLAGTLSGGEAQMLALGRCLMASPRYLLLDEPTLGLAPQVVEHVMQVVTSLRSRGLGILLVEQNAHLALAVSDRGVVLEAGVATMVGTGRDLLGQEGLQRAYFGA